ncbi:hypothetical protein WJX81_001573 [Elliptochloris bilobata]|uniref:Transcription elongation factor n=1 Tax=Elliptochloris bilobata TaxID=381761 RepID=A0AAW1R221_9CHLO
MAASVDELRLLVDAALAAGAAVDDDPEAASRAVFTLDQLAQQQVTTQVLVDSNAGKLVRRLTKHTDQGIAATAARVVATWKEAIALEQKAALGDGYASGPSSANAAPPLERSNGAAAAAAAPMLPRPPAKPLIVPKCGDGNRDKTRLLLAEALTLAAGGVPGADAGAAAADVEVAMFRQAGGVTPGYKATYRRLVQNLRDPANPDLRRRVLAREITGDVLVTLSAEELASDARKADNSRIRQTALAEAERGQHMKTATTDQFQCGKCRQRQCQYYQMQTRSADEPMTTFVTCVNCGNRWKFC